MAARKLLSAPHYTRDAFTFDQMTVDSTGAFLVSELERMDQTMHEPLLITTWSRDMPLREDVSIGHHIRGRMKPSVVASWREFVEVARPSGRRIAKQRDERSKLLLR